jgi:hypothetical protein
MGSGGKVLRICNLGNIRSMARIGGWVGLGLVAVEKRKISCLCRESNRLRSSNTIQSYIISITDSTIKQTANEIPKVARVIASLRAFLFRIYFWWYSGSQHNNKK